MTTLTASLRQNADLTEKALDFMSDPEQLEESKADIDLWRAAADEIERLRDRLDRALSYREGMENLPEGTIPRD